MYNTDLPRRADLPTAAQLKRSTVIAAVSALVILVTVVLPSEYAIDPTGVGRLTGLTAMGEIKTGLTAEAAADTAGTALAAPAPANEAALTQRLDRIEALLVAQQKALASRTAPAAQPAPAPEPAKPASVQPAPASVQPVPAPEPARPAPVVAAVAAPAPAAGRSDQVSFTLTPGQGAEIKLVMRQGARASFAWTSSGGPVNFDTHGDAPGQAKSYVKGRNVASDDGVLEAAFDGNHGWFWRNRATAPVTLTLRTSGDYKELKRVL